MFQSRRNISVSLINDKPFEYGEHGSLLAFDLNDRKGKTNSILETLYFMKHAMKKFGFLFHRMT